MRIRDYRYVNDELIDDAIDQLGGLPVQFRKKRIAGLAATGPVVTWQSDEVESDFGRHRKIDFLIDAMRSKGLLAERRPEALLSVHQLNQDFVYETCQAVQMLIPVSEELKSLGYTAFKLWVSEPDPSDFTDIEWDYKGSYLFLTELQFDKGKHSSFISGVSALRFITNAAHGSAFLDRSGGEILGRFDERRIAEKLVGIGAKLGPPSVIETLYRIRYMTNEQWSPASGGRRVHDLVGYPLFISRSG